jgi:hypothetical protein
VPGAISPTPPPSPCNTRRPSNWPIPNAAANDRGWWNWKGNGEMGGEGVVGEELGEGREGEMEGRFKRRDRQ